MGIKDKLARFDKTMPRRSGQKKSEKPSIDLSHLLPGAEAANAAGTIWRNRVEYPLDHCHGLFPLKNLIKQTSTLLKYAARDAALPAIDLESLLFFDTETTGLSGGVGTVAFLLGVGFFEKSRFVIEQYFMRQYAEEPALLYAFMTLLKKTAGGKGALVSFNGRAFDIPLVINRSIFHRTRLPTDSLPHIDLLFGARRLWKKVLPDCSLATLESRLLKVKRTGDIPSHLIPEIYFRYLRSRDPRPLVPVFYHNQVDILSMVTLLILKLTVMNAEPDSISVPLDRLAVGRLYEDMGEATKAHRWYSEMLNSKLPAPEHKQALLKSALMHKRDRHYHRACKLWKEAINFKGFVLEPYEELAKAYEHHLHDLHAAKYYVEAALTNITSLDRLYRDPAFGRAREDLLWRLQRIERKIQG